MSFAMASDWPQWRGPNRDGLSLETGLLKEWPKEGPPRFWMSGELGGGYASPVVAAGKIFGVGKLEGKEVAWCLNESDGKRIWTKVFATPGKVGYDEGPRSTPTYYSDPRNGAQLYVLGTGGDLVCLKAETGEKVWSRSLVKDFGGHMMSGWGYSESPLVDGDKVICSPGADGAALVALDRQNGEIIWKASIAMCGGAGYASPVKALVGGIPMYVTWFGKTGGIVGVHAETGKLLWRYNKVANGTANIPTSIVRDNLIWCSTGYSDGGSALLWMTLDEKNKNQIKLKELKSYDKVLQNHHGGMVLVGDYLYFGADHGQGFPACVDFKTGQTEYKLNKPLSGGLGSAAVIAADGMLYFYYQNGQIVLVNATPVESELKVSGSFKIPDPSSHAKWAHPVIANSKLYLRDQDKLHCYDIKANKR